MNKTWLDTCITAGEFLYGEYPVSVLKQLYETRGEIVISDIICYSGLKRLPSTGAEIVRRSV